MQPSFRRYVAPVAMLVAVLAVSFGLVHAGPKVNPAGERPPGSVEPDPTSLVVVFQRQKEPEKVKRDADAFAQALSARLGIPVEAVIPADYSASVQALVSKKADVAYISAMPFLLARRDGNASILLAESRQDAHGDYRTDYDSILVTRADSAIKSYADLKANTKQCRVVFTSPTSTSGYVMPLARFVDEGVVKKGQDPREVFASVVFGGSYTAALEQVLSGRADVAAVSDYTMEGPRADVYLPKAKREQLRILERTPGVPTHVLAMRFGPSDDFRLRLREAFVAVSEKNPELLAGVYGATRLVPVDEEEHVRKAIEAIAKTGIPVEGLAR
jgi:phosphonate transport system substrate-binding protein